MTNSYLRGKEFEMRYKNNMLSPEEALKKREEEDNTKKMTSILKQMNYPRNVYQDGGGNSGFGSRKNSTSKGGN
jgi:hypothetical protein